MSLLIKEFYIFLFEIYLPFFQEILQDRFYVLSYIPIATLRRCITIYKKKR